MRSQDRALHYSALRGKKLSSTLEYYRGFAYALHFIKLIKLESDQVSGVFLENYTAAIKMSELVSTCRGGFVLYMPTAYIWSRIDTDNFVDEVLSNDDHLS